MNTPLVIGGVELGSRLFLGTGKFGSSSVMRKSLAASGTQLVTVALRRVRTDGAADDILSHLEPERYRLLPNTSGVRDRREAIFADDADRQRMLETLTETCQKTGWQVHG